LKQTVWKHVVKCILASHVRSVFERFSVQRTAWSRVLLEKLTVSDLIKKSYETQQVRCCVHNSLPLVLVMSHINSVTQSHPISLRSILKLSSHLCLGHPGGLFCLGLPKETVYAFCSICHTPHSFQLSWFECPNNGWGV